MVRCHLGIAGDLYFYALISSLFYRKRFVKVLIPWWMKILVGLYLVIIAADIIDLKIKYLNEQLFQFGANFWC